MWISARALGCDRWAIVASRLEVADLVGEQSKTVHGEHGKCCCKGREVPRNPELLQTISKRFVHRSRTSIRT
jgi:hypothetical protein